MATATLAEEHQVGQATLVSLIPDVLRQAWPLLDPHDISGTLPRFIAAVKAIVARYGAASAAAALDYYRHQRVAAGVVAPVALGIAPSPADALIEDAVRLATATLYGQVTDESVAEAQARLDSAVQHLILDQSRRTIIDATNKDRKAKGWVRVTEPDACSFCLMLALRGPKYRSEASANFRAHTRSLNGSGGDCQCHAEPIFTAYEPSARMREVQHLWDNLPSGLSGKETRKAFRAAVEGRPYLPTKKSRR